MKIIIKTLTDIAKMRIAGKLAAEVLEMVEAYVQPGISTGELDVICHNYITQIQHAVSAPLGYRGFPKSICTSINDVVCHGIPNNSDKLKEGDIINIDITVIKDGLYADTSRMFIVGQPTRLGYRLCKITQESLYLAIRMIKPGIRLKKVGRSIQRFVENQNFSIVREYCGHGIGKFFHEAPHVLHYDADDEGVILKSGMTLTIEPMVNAGTRHIYTDNDGWTVKTRDHNLSAQYEHTIVVTENGCEVLTLRSDESLSSII
ncbi:type I methionyl aminopeptidase [Blochmannia endosymbiont of Camponotus sp. C-003]|uniref:type I methionyl aminopeptidase n=1 Tax=Blochmannia endosymbiont of Camponotus sp. C-003 TaxID=2945588 RepID=UPI002024BFF6|nr:type I methionyl aminopeptidase [Blochmannia endosymbiont of Camponotus sp. C-003]URJ23537.1 type I methionyl aminopeptidase [Blochmannia endosymbiont of Camponotus sp. C-003]